jgi:preprotein translocase subunit SecG
MLGGLLLGILILVSVLLCLLILFQESKGGGLAGALGGYGMKSAFGAKTAQKLTKFTAYVAAAFFILVLVLGIFNKPKGIGGIQELPGQEGPKEPAGEEVEKEAAGGGLAAPVEGEGEAEESPPDTEKQPAETEE